ncbi:MAG: DUF5679 domain-containing protein [Candidatus Bathyarchaeota archaeon]
MPSAKGLKLYCFKCKAKRNAIDAKQVKMKNGRPAIQAACEKCGTKMFQIGMLEN